MDESYLMTYGDDWPPPPPPPTPTPRPRRRRRYSLPVRCLAAVVTYALIAAFGLALLRIREAEVARTGPPAQVAQTARPHGPAH